MRGKLQKYMGVVEELFNYIYKPHQHLGKPEIFVTASKLKRGAVKKPDCGMEWKDS